jgi:DNA-binding SARP family transcriptional activator
MHTLTIQLFSKFSVEWHDRNLSGFDSCKVQELFSYLLIHRNRPHPREVLASLLWGDSSTEKAKKYLRQALWHLQLALDLEGRAAGGGMLVTEHDWIQFNPDARCWLDVAAFEQAAEISRDQPGRGMSKDTMRALQKAVKLYKGDLLEGWYQDWCLYERERLQNMFFVMLHKLMSYCAAHQEYEEGQSYGSQILRFDRASERTHRLLMQLYYLAGDRTAALRQYERCVAALDEELSVKPDKKTIRLCEQIRADQLDQSSSPGPVEDIKDEAPAPAAKTLRSLPDMLTRLHQLQHVLNDVQHVVQQDIRLMELAIKLKAQHLLNR